MRPQRPHRRLPALSFSAVTAGLAAAAALVVLLAPGPGAASPATRGAVAAPSARGRLVSVAFLRGERIALVRRDVVVPGVARGALLQLFAGPTAAERRAGLSSAVPAGTRLRGVTIRGGLASADLSRRFESGGGSLSVSARLAQLTWTLTQFSTVRGVLLRLDGRPVRVFSGEGLILDHPLTRADFRSFG